MTRPRLLILDVDGTLRWTDVAGARYPVAPGQWRLMPRVGEVLRALPWEEGLALGIASNQPGVGAGELPERLARRMIRDALREALGRVPPRAAVELCTCPEGRPCPRRKPGPGMLLSHLRRFSVAPGDALFVGDLPIDRDAAARAGIPFRWAGEFFGWHAAR